MKKLTIYLAMILLFSSCEEEFIDSPINKTKTFTIEVGVKDWTTYEVEFPELQASSENPFYNSRFSETWSKFKILEIESDSPLIIRAKHFGADDWIYCKVYNDGALIASDSLKGKVKEIWINYQWE